VFLKTLPLTANGKIDRDALPEPEAAAGKGQFVAPRNPVEMELSRIWATVLGLQEVGIHDNFFELGGDSILGIQIVARANKAGMNLEPRQIFDHQTIAELAGVAKQAPVAEAEQETITGEVTLSPVQAHFFELGLHDPHYYNQARLLKLRAPVVPELLRSAVEKLLLHHDALRLRFYCSGQEWKQVNSEPQSTVPFELIDISENAETEINEILRTHAAWIHASLNLQEGPIIRVALFDGAGATPSYLLIVIHHLAVDTVSWNVLLEDLELAYHKTALPPKTTSFKAWTRQLAEFAHSSTIEREIDYWTSRLAQPITNLPVDYSGPNTVATRRTISVSLTASETRSVLQDLPAKHRTQINEVLLAAIARTFTAWMGTPSFLLDLEGHGREQIVEGVDLTRTVGWFTAIFPVLLDTGKSSTPLEVLRVVKEQLRAVPNRGIGYGLLRYLSGRKDVSEQLSRLPQAEVRFNYLGQQVRSLSSSQLFLSAHDSGADAQSLRDERGYLLNIIASVSDSQLRFNWTYSENVHASKTIERLAETCLAELRALLSEGDSVYAPSDFPKAKLSQKDLNAVLAKLRR
jgi:non-ribosomal peptide synthase protein (TIGR01720 family)